MPDLQYGITSFERTEGNLPQLPVQNMFVEKAEPEQNPVLQSRPGMTANYSVGAGPITGIYSTDGVFSGNVFAVSGGTLYQTLTSRGAIAGSGPTKMAGFQGTPNRLFVTKGTSLYEWNGTTLATVATPGSFNVRSLCVGTDRLVVVDDTTGHFYWSDVLSDTIQALSFATAEQSPDNLQDILFVGDTLVLFGSETVEYWPASSANASLPFVPLIGRTAPVGIRATGCCTKFTNTFAWVTNHHRVCVGDATNYISDPSLEEKISASTACSLWNFFLEGIEFLAVTLDTETFVFSSHSSQWSTFTTYGSSNWWPQCYANGNFGSSATAHILVWTSAYLDNGNLLERIFRAGQAVTSGTVPLYNLTLRTNPGQTSYTVGTYANPVVSMRMSKDGGQTWGAWNDTSLGAQGLYRAAPTWRSMGFFGYPALLVEFRVQHPVPFRVSGVVINDDYSDINV